MSLYNDQFYVPGLYARREIENDAVVNMLDDLESNCASLPIPVDVDLINLLLLTLPVLEVSDIPLVICRYSHL